MRSAPGLVLAVLLAACSGGQTAPVTSPSGAGTPTASPSTGADTPASTDDDASAGGSSAAGRITGSVEIVDDKRADREGTYEIEDTGEGSCIVDPFSTEPVVDASLYAAEEVEGQLARVTVDHARIVAEDGEPLDEGGRVEIRFAPATTSAEHLYRFESTPELTPIGTGSVSAVRTGDSVVIRFEGEDDDGSTFRGEVDCPAVIGLT